MKIRNLINTTKFIVNHPVNRGSKIGAMLRFAKWQIGSRLVPGQVVYEWINEVKLIVRPGETGLTGNIYCGLHEFEDMSYVLHVLNSEDLFVDVGANVGSYTLLACGVKGARGYAFEPVPETFSRLQENLRINRLDIKVRAFNMGLADKDGVLSFTTEQGCVNNVVTDEDKSGKCLQVEVLTLDTALEGESPCVIKIDVEGFEAQVISGAHMVLSNESLHSVVMELNGSESRYGFSEEKLLKTMLDYGFSTYSYEPFSRGLTSLEGKNNQSGNTLFIRNESAISRRLKVAPKIKVGNVEI